MNQPLYMIYGKQLLFLQKLCLCSHRDNFVSDELSFEEGSTSAKKKPRPFNPEPV